MTRPRRDLEFLSGQVSRNEPGSILVAVSRLSSEWGALEWAAAEAAARACRLRVLNVVRWPNAGLDVAGTAVPLLWDDAAAQAGRRLLAAATSRVRQIAPTVPVDTDLRIGTPGQEILNAGQDSSLIVLGRGHPRRKSMSRTARYVVRRGSGPVAVIGLMQQGVSPAVSVGRIVLVTTEKDALTSLGAAFRAAARRGVGLTVVDLDGAGGPVRLGDRNTMGTIISAGAAAFPDVPVSHHTAAATAPSRIAADSCGAALVMIGVNGTWLHRRRLTSVQRVLIRSASGPVAFLSNRRASLLWGGGWIRSVAGASTNR